MDFAKFMLQVRTALGLAPDADLGATIAELVQLNALVRTLTDEKEKIRTDMGEIAAELRGRLARREKLDSQEVGMHIDQNGRVRPNVSRECAEHLVGLMRGNRVLSAGTDSEGGYLVAPEFAAEILRLVPTVGLYERVARIIPMKSDEMNIGTLASGITVYWPAENAAITPSYPAFGRLTLNAKILAGYTEAPENLMDDASPELGQFIADLFIEGLAKEGDRVGLAGDVTGASDPFNGILFASGTVPKVMGTGLLATADITSDHLLDLQTTVPDGAREDCRYFLSPTVFDNVRKLKDGNSAYIWQAPSAGAPGTIWGKPYELSERMPAHSTTDTASKSFVAYGNPKHLILGDRKQISVKSSDVAGTTFKQIQTAIRVHRRIAVNSYAGGFAKLVTAAS